MGAWTISQYEHLKECLQTDINNLRKEIAKRKEELTTEKGGEKLLWIKQRLVKLSKYLTQAEDSLKRFEFRYTHNGKGPEEWSDEDEETVMRRAEKARNRVKIDYDKIDLINPKTGKKYSKTRIRKLVMEGKLKLD